MWESVLSTSHGRTTPVRGIITYVFAALIATLLWCAVSPQNAHAADITWNGANELFHGGNTYNGPVAERAVDNLGLLTGTKAYTYVEPETANNRKIHVIYFAPGVDPGSAEKANYRNYTYNAPENYTNGSTAQALDITPQPADDPDPNSCDVDGGLGWIICPVTNTLAQWMDWIFEVLASFLEVRPVQTSQESALYRAWTYMRTFANIAFVIAFMVIIYSQLTSVGISNYGIKKLLPRIIVAAILVNISYIICAIAIDISNVLGYSIQNIFIGMRNTLVGAEGNSWDVLSWESIASFVLSSGAVAAGAGIGIVTAVASSGGVVAAALAILLPALVILIVAVLVALLIMATRQALITILTILSPLAFVAYLLPNTEKWFSKWRSTFMTMLILFPAFSIIFGGSQLAGSVIIQNANSLNLILLGMIVQVAPLFVTPLLIKFSGSLIGRIAGIVNNPNKGIIDRTRNFAKDRAENMKARNLATPAKRWQIGKRAAQRMDYGRRRREGMRSAHTSLADGLFTQSRAGQEVAHLQHKAGFEKEDGESRSHEAWNRELNDPHGLYRTRRVEQVRRRSTGDLEKAAVEADSKEAYERSVVTDPRLRTIRTDQIAAEGRAKLHADKSTALGEYALRYQIEHSAPLSRTVSDTHSLQQQAATSEGIVKSNAEANWNRAKMTNATIRGAQLAQQEASTTAKHAEEEWNSLVQEAVAKGNDPNESIKHLSKADRDVAQKLKQISLDTTVESERQKQFEVHQRGDVAKALKNDDIIRLRAGGDTAEGANRVFAQATSTIVSEEMDNIKNSRSIISDYTAAERQTLWQQGLMRATRSADGTIKRVKATESERLAAYQETLAKGNNLSVQQLRDVIAEQGMYYDDTSGLYYNSQADLRAGVNMLSDTEVDMRRTRQQIFVDAYKSSKHTVTSISGRDKGDMEAGLFQRSSRQAIVKDIVGDKFKPIRWQQSDLDEMNRIVQVLRRSETYDELSRGDNRESVEKFIESINDALEDPRINVNLDGRSQGIMRVLERYAQNALDGKGMPTYDEKVSFETEPVFFNNDDRAHNKSYRPPVVAPEQYNHRTQTNDTTGPVHPTHPSSGDNRHWDDNNDSLS